MNEPPRIIPINPTNINTLGFADLIVEDNDNSESPIWSLDRQVTKKKFFQELHSPNSNFKNILLKCQSPAINFDVNMDDFKGWNQ